MSSSQAIIRTEATSIIGSQYLATQFSQFTPQAPALAKAHVREVSNQVSRSQNFAPGNRVRFEVQRDFDVMTLGVLRFTRAALPVASWAGGATFTRWVDLHGLAAWTQCVVKSGTQTLQTIVPLEVLVFIQKMLDDEHRTNILRMLGQGTPAERTATSLAAEEISCPFLTTLGLNLHGDMSQGLYVRGLNDLLSVEFTLAAANEVVETDGTMPTAPLAQDMYTNGLLAVEGYHLTRAERALIAHTYKSQPFAITFRDQQFATQISFIGSTALNGQTISNPITNINQPVEALAFIFRWANDTGRTAGQANGTRGRNLFNLAGWLNPGGGATNEFIGNLAIRSGNNDVLAAIPAKRLIGYQHDRDFKGLANTAIPAVSFSFDATLVNAVLGFQSWDQVCFRGTKLMPGVAILLSANHSKKHAWHHSRATRVR